MDITFSPCEIANLLPVKTKNKQGLIDPNVREIFILHADNSPTIRTNMFLS